MAYGFDEPNVTIKLLAKLRRTGYADNQFSADHHFAKRGKRVTISEHVAYCQARKKFQRDGNNGKLQELLYDRLEERTGRKFNRDGHIQ